MSRINDTVRTVNSSLRTVLGLAFVGMLGAGGWFGYTAYVEPGRRLDVAKAELDEARRQLEVRDERILEQTQEISRLAEDVLEKSRQIAQLETSLRLLKIDHRIAELRVVAQVEDPATGGVRSTVQFIEINDEGAPIDDPKQFTIDGDIVYVEAMVVKFNDEFIEQADPDRSTSLCLFQRLWGEFQQPSEGFAIDEVGSRPTAYARGGRMSDFEKTIWQNFWDIANDATLAKEMGVRTSQIEAPGMKVRPGKVYRITLRASDGLSILPAQDDTSRAAPKPDA